MSASAESRRASKGARSTDVRAPLSVQLQLLHACNLRCGHCYDAAAPRRAQPTTEELKRRIAAVHAFAAAHGFEPDFHLSGGEPTLRPDLVELVRTLTQDHGGDPLLFTNGTRWTRARARELAAVGLRYVQVSLEGPEALTDAVRGEGVFREAMQTLALLADEGFYRTVSVTVTASNFPSLFDFVGGLDQPGLHFHLREVFPLGAGVNLQALGREERRRLSEWAIAWRGKATVNLEDPVHCSVSRDYAKQRKGCVAGRSHLCIDVDGAVFPCRPLAYAVGTVDDLAAAWHSPAMTRLRERDLGGQCGRCELKHHCGGCRVHALASGDVFGEDTRCFADENGLLLGPWEAQAVRAAERLGAGVWRARQWGERIVNAARRLPLLGP